MKLMFLAIEVNLILWLAMVGVALDALPGSVGSAKAMAIVGAGFAAVLQHWAYYRLRRPAAES